MSRDRLNGDNDVLLCEQPATTTPTQQRSAARTAASHATDTGELATLLAMLGIDPQEAHQ